MAPGGGGVQYTCLVGCRPPPLDGYVSVYLVLIIDIYGLVLNMISFANWQERGFFCGMLIKALKESSNKTILLPKKFRVNVFGKSWRNFFQTLKGILVRAAERYKLHQERFWLCLGSISDRWVISRTRWPPSRPNCDSCTLTRRTPLIFYHNDLWTAWQMACSILAIYNNQKLPNCINNCPRRFYFPPKTK